MNIKSDVVALNDFFKSENANGNIASMNKSYYKVMDIIDDIAWWNEEIKETLQELFDIAVEQNFESREKRVIEHDGVELQIEYVNNMLDAMLRINVDNGQVIIKAFAYTDFDYGWLINNLSSFTHCLIEDLHSSFKNQVKFYGSHV